MVYQVSGGYPLSSGRQTRYQAVTLEMSANLILLLYHNFRPSVKKKIKALVLSKRAVFPPKPKHWDSKPTIPLKKMWKCDNMSMTYKFKDDSLQQYAEIPKQNTQGILGTDLSVLTPVISPQGKLKK